MNDRHAPAGHASLADTPRRPPPYAYVGSRVRGEPDWRRLPGFREVSPLQWRDQRWQRAHSVVSPSALAATFGHSFPLELLDSIELDQRQMATMALRVTPQVLNTMDETNLWEDPVRRYVLPASFDRETEWHSHPLAQRDSLHEAPMWAAEGLVHRYPTKVLVEMRMTCPVYCGYCTRMDLVGPDAATVEKRRFVRNEPERLQAILGYIRQTTEVRDIVVSGGDVSSVPLRILVEFLRGLMAIEHVRDIRLATKAVGCLPQYFLDPEVLRVLGGIAEVARARGVRLAVHTHINHARSVTDLVTEAARNVLNIGFHSVRNQAVLARGVNDSAKDLLDLSFALIDAAGIEPYYVFMGDVVPYAEHWRVPLHKGQALQDQIMGYLPGFSTPRVTVDVPLVGKRLAHQAEQYDRTTGISCWRRSHALGIDAEPISNDTQFRYYDPIWSLPPEGQEYWRQRLAHSHA